MTVDPVSGGGCAERTFQMTRALARNGVQCDLLVLDIGLTDERLNLLENTNIHVQPCLLERYYVPRVSIGRMNRLVKNADIVHLMGHWEFPDALIYPLLRYHNKPYVNCPAGSLKVQGRSRIIKSLYNLVIGNQIIRNASKMIAISTNEFQQFRQYGVRDEEIALIPNGINPEDYAEDDDKAFRRRYKLGDQPFILFIGRLNPIKGPDLLIKAFSLVANSYPHHQLVFAGPDDGMQKALIQLAADAGMSKRVHFTGFLGQNEKSMALHAAEFLVIPSRSEAMSIVVLEAGAASTPVLATDQCGLNNIVDIGGGDIAPATIKGLEEGLRHMLSAGSALRSMGRALHQFVLADFTWQAMSERMAALYREILSR